MPACDASKTAAQYKVAASWRLRRGRCTDHSLPHGFAGVEFVLVGDDHVTAFIQAIGHLRKIQRAKSDPDCARMYNAMLHASRLIDKQSACRHQKSVVMRPGHDVHLDFYSRH